MGNVNAKVRSGELVVRDRGLLDEIIASLADNADGMFLWVVFQIADICEESTTDGIRAALRNLPKDLPETYQRALEKIHKRITSDALMAKKTFQWIICAKRPLFMDELKEALAVKPGDKDLNYNRIPNDDSRIIRACANLVVFDKDTCKVSLAHHTVQEFLLGRPMSTAISSTFRFNLSRANNELAEVCLTYFHFNAFETQLTHTVDVPAPDMDVLVSELRNNRRHSIVSFGRYGRNFRKKIDWEGHRLLQYLIEYWLYHTAELTPYDSDLWNSFQNLVLDKSLPFNFKPWKEVSPNPALPYLPILAWAIEEENVALLDMMLLKILPGTQTLLFYFGQMMVTRVLTVVLKRCQLHILEILFAKIPEFDGVIAICLPA
ncbi:hypothetical protein K440DRAFT_671281 [Wilcoxina mikolae CBS 423.85]|nr:hypothetical protein K440DRAFT_671281 [Wilcoxina mikolae CBS 423.85]